jgi:hypothetical protein
VVLALAGCRELSSADEVGGGGEPCDVADDVTFRVSRGGGEVDADIECWVHALELRARGTLRIYLACIDDLETLVDISGLYLDEPPLWQQGPESGRMQFRWVDDPRHEYEGWATLRHENGWLVFAVLDYDYVLPFEASWDPLEVEPNFDDCRVSDDCAIQPGAIDVTDTRDGESVHVLGGETEILSNFTIFAGKIERQPTPGACAVPEGPRFQHAILWSP